MCFSHVHDLLHVTNHGYIVHTLVSDQILSPTQLILLADQTSTRAKTKTHIDHKQFFDNLHLVIRSGNALVMMLHVAIQLVEGYAINTGS